MSKTESKTESKTPQAEGDVDAAPASEDATTALRRGRGLLVAGLLTAALAVGCEPKAPQPETTTATTTTTTTGTALPGVRPHDDNTLPASDRPGAVAIGAVEAGQGGGGSHGGQHPAPTAGDGTASAPAPSASR